jgi:PKD repeat protein
MKTIRTLLAVIILLYGATLTYSKTVPAGLARQVALNAWAEKALRGSDISTPVSVTEPHVVQSSTGLPVYYIFNVSGGEGFIIIAGDDRITPVLGWSDKGPWSDTNRPPAFDWFMNTIRSQAEMALLGEDRAAPAVTADWDRYSAPGFVPAKVIDAGPLLQTTWDQDCFYNEQCPADAAASGSCFHAYAGCGATAMAQILKYWNFPQHGTGSYGYTHSTYGYLFANFAGSTYKYSAMPDALPSGNTEVAQLIYHCGVAQEMDYGPSSSSCDVLAIDAAFRNYFDYNPALAWKLRTDYSASAWQSMLIAEINAGRPLLYYGNDNGAVGHAFVCDGYQGTTYFHFNWGWSGTYDGFFYLDNLTPGGSVYTDNQRAIFDLRPNQAAGITTMDFESAADFSLTFDPWTVADVDGKPTFVITGHTFPHQGEAMAYIAFNPAQVTPSMASDAELQPHGGLRFGACFSATTPSNNDWFISPQVQLDYFGSFSLWVKSYTASYGLEKYRVAVSTTDNNPSSFTEISGITPLQAQTDWTKVTFDLSAYNGQAVYLGVQCVSDTSFIFMIDDLEIDPGVTGALIADFTADHTTVNPGQTVNFTDASVGTPTSWNWTFQGGTPYNSTDQNPTNIRYDNPGIYDVTLTVSDGTNSDTRTKTGYIYVTQTLPSQMSLDFESLADFTTTFAPWTTIDVNGGETYNIQGVTFPGSGYPMAWICFNPSATTPPLTSSPAHSGVRLGASFASPPPWAPSNKWLITPKMFLGTGGKIDLWVRSYTVQYGDEEYNICVSETGTSPGDFTSLNGIHPEKAPVSWTLRSYSLSAYAGKEVYIGIQCVSNDRFIFMIDDISITSTVGIDEKEAASVLVYPNPTSGELFVRFTEDAPAAYSGELFNAVGSKVRSFTVSDQGNLPVSVNAKGLSEGIYFLKLTYGSTSLIKKVIILE